MELDRKINKLIRLRGRGLKSQRKTFKEAALYDFNGTLVSDMKGSGMEIYKRKLFQAFGPLLETGNGEIIKIFGKNGLTIAGKNSTGKKFPKSLSESVISLIKSPKRGTKARDIYYDFLELAVERGEIGLRAFPDVFMKGNLIEKDREAGLAIISLSRGTDSILKKSLDASGTGKIIDKMYSTIPFGGEKNAECYYGFYMELLAKGIRVTKSYEDEWKNVEAMFEADLALGVRLKLRAPPFKIIWIDRAKDRGRGEIKRKIAVFEKAYRIVCKKYGWEMRFGELLQVHGGLIAK